MKDIFNIPNNTLRNLLFCLIAILVCTYHYGNDIHFKPHGVHSWAQGDRYSICLNYYEHGLQLFYPRVHSIEPGPDRIVSCEPNITGYIAACLLKPFGLRIYLPFMARFINLLFVLWGLWSLFDVIYRNTHHFIISLIPLFFAFTSPLIIHYSFNFLSDTSSLGFSWLAFALLTRFFLEKKIKILYWALAAMTFAALLKMSFAIYLSAFIVISLYALWEKNSPIQRYILYLSSVFAAFLTIISLYFWIKHLKVYDHSSIFLTQAFIFKGNIYEWSKYIEKVFNYWYLAYFNRADFYYGPVLLFAFVYYAVKNRKTVGTFILLSVVLMIGALSLIFYIMSANFLAHDYYFIACGFPFIMFLLIWGSIGLHSLIVRTQSLVGFRNLPTFGISIALIILWAYQFGIIKTKCQDWRWDKEKEAMAWMVEHKTDLSSLGVEKDALVCVYGDFTPNLGLAVFERYGCRYQNDITANPMFFFENQKDYPVRYLIVNEQDYLSMKKYFPNEFEKLVVKKGDTYWLIAKK